MALLYGRAGRLTAKNGGFRPRRAVIQETETTDRRSLALPGWQLPLLQAVVASGTPVVLFVMNAGPVDLAWAKVSADTLSSLHTLYTSSRAPHTAA
jgi:hypothetical protein